MALFWLSDGAWGAIEPHLPKNQPGARRVGDRRVISGILRMEGVEDEFHLFRTAQPNAPAFPVASTGAAAAVLFDSDSKLQQAHPELMKEISYINLMRNLISPPHH